jgi:hypothetical protein
VDLIEGDAMGSTLILPSESSKHAKKWSTDALGFAFLVALAKDHPDERESRCWLSSSGVLTELGCRERIPELQEAEETDLERKDRSESSSSSLMSGDGRLTEILKPCPSEWVTSESSDCE